MSGFRIFICICLGSVALSASAQEVVCSAMDSLDFERRIAIIQELPTDNKSDLLIEVGKTFLNTPYVAHTLDKNQEEELVINFLGLDCTTFLENAITFTLMRCKEQNSLEDFAAQLTEIRYRKGVRDGYASRLHYFTEWIADNEEKGILEDVTQRLGGEMADASRTFMSSHRESYPMLANEAHYQEILEAEAQLKASPYYVIPHSSLRTLESRLKDGDILAFATKIDGLDVTHTALVIKQENRVHMLHASSSGQVEISKLPMLEYIKGIKHSSGLIVARLKEQ